MIKTQLKHLSRWLLAAIVVSVVVAVLAGVITTRTIEQLHRLGNIEVITADIEVNLDEMTASARRYLIGADRHARLRVAGSYRDIQRAFSRLAPLTDDAPTPLSANLAALEQQSARLYRLANALIDIVDRQHALSARVKAWSEQLDGLYAAPSPPRAAPRAARLIDEFQGQLTDAAADAALASTNVEAMPYARSDLAHMNRLLDKLAALELSPAQRQWHAAAAAAVSELQGLLASIAELHKQALDKRAAFDRLVVELDTLVDELIQAPIAARRKRQVLQLQAATGALFVLTLLLSALIGFILRRMVVTAKVVGHGVDQLLALTGRVARDEGVDAAALPDADGEFRQIGRALLDMRETVDATLLSRQRVVRLLDQIGTLHLVLTHDNAFSHCSPGLCRLLGVADTEAAARVLRGQLDFELNRQLVHYGLLKDLDWQLKDVQGRLHRVRVRGGLLDKGGLLFIGNPQADYAADGPGEAFPVTFEGLVMVRENGVIHAANVTAERLLGVADGTARGQTLASLWPQQGCAGAAALRDLAGLASAGKAVELTVGPEGAKHHIQAHVYALESAEAGGTVYALTLHDISWVRRSEARAHRLAFYDSLTGLPNRSLLVEQLGRAINVSRRHGSQFAVLFVDLDGFKDINDSLGHQAGNRLLETIGKRIQEQLRDTDFAGRLSGDEFCVVTDELDRPEYASHLAGRMLEVINRLYRLGYRTLAPRASIGISIYPDDGAAPEALLQAADTAMYEAKRRGKHQFAFYTEDMTEHVRQRMTLECDLRAALQARQFVLLYQPQVDLRSGRLVGVEALIRWQHPQRGLLPPDEFIATAERLGLLESIGHWVIQAACEQLTAWDRAGVELPRMAINIDPAHFQQPGFAQEVATVLQDHGVEPKRLEIEITESMARDVEALTKTCTELKSLGVRVAIDDFGVDYSSLSVLKTLQVHTLKIDQLFLRGVQDDLKTALILGGIIAMAKGLALETVIEGVETQEQLVLVLGLGCSRAQGYHLGKPRPASEIPALTRVDFTVHGRSSPKLGNGHSG